MDDCITASLQTFNILHSSQHQERFMIVFSKTHRFVYVQALYHRQCGHLRSYNVQKKKNHLNCHWKRSLISVVHITWRRYLWALLCLKNCHMIDTVVSIAHLSIGYFTYLSFK